MHLEGVYCVVGSTTKHSSNETSNRVWFTGNGEHTEML